MTDTCANCRFFMRDETPSAQSDWCRRYPKKEPKLSDDWCGEFRPVEPAKAVPDADGWIPWEGGSCPVDPGALVHVRLRDGTVRRWAPRASEYDWRNTGASWNIRYYREVEEGT